MRSNKSILRISLGFLAFLTVLPLGAAAWAQAPAPAKGRCAAAVQGKIAWNYSGNKTWSAANIARLCKGAENSVQPARCFKEVMHGGINWGGGTRWQWRNAVDLCQGTKNARARISCFKKKVANDAPWRRAISDCRRADSLGSVGGLRAQPGLGLRKPGLKAPGGVSKTKPDMDSPSGAVRFGDGEHGRRPESGRDGGQVRPGTGPSGRITDRPLKERNLGSKGAADLRTADPNRRGRLTLRPRVTGYRPSTVMQGGEVSVQGRMFGQSKGSRRLILGVNADPDHGLARELRPRRWTENEIRTAVPANVLPAKYFIALVDADGKWVTNRLQTLRVLGRQRVSIRGVIELKCYAEVKRYPKRLHAVLKPTRPEEMGMEADERIRVPIPYRQVASGRYGSYLYVYTTKADIPQGLFKASLHRPDGEPVFKAKDWSRSKGAAGYEVSKPCFEHRRVDHRTGTPLRDPLFIDFRIDGVERTVRITRRTRKLELKETLYANIALPEPTPVDE